MHNVRAVAATVALLAVLATPAASQTAADILNSAMEKYRQRTASIENYTVVQSTMAGEMTMYFEKEMVDGVPVFMMRTTGVTGQTMPVGASDAIADYSRMAGGSTYLGRETIDGHATHAIRIDDAATLGLAEAVSESAGQSFETQSIVMYLDEAELVPRRIRFEGSLTMSGQTRPVTSTIDLTDYRDVGGMLHPFRTTMSMEGMMDAMAAEMTPEKIEEAKKQIADFETQMAAMPESQRAMIERVMGDRIDQLRSMLESAGTSFTFEVRELRVNSGPPTNRNQHQP